MSEHVCIGSGTIILSSITIGNDAITGAGSVVAHDVAASATVMGNAAGVSQRKS